MKLLIASGQSRRRAPPNASDGFAEDLNGVCTAPFSSHLLGERRVLSGGLAAALPCNLAFSLINVDGYAC